MLTRTHTHRKTNLALTVVLFILTLTFTGLSVQAFSPATMYALTNDNRLLTFNSATPGTINNTVAITGLQANELVVGIDMRPATGELYALGLVDDGATRTGRIYKIDPATGVATQVGATPWSTTLADTDFFGFNFNPNVDRIRITNRNGQNFRVDPNTGALAAIDTNLSSNGINGVSYTNNDLAMATTTLYALNFDTDQLVTIGGLNGTPSPNGGVVNIIGTTGLVGLDVYGFEITTGAGVTTAFATTNRNFYTLNLATGAFTLVGAIGNGQNIILAITAALPGPRNNTIEVSDQKAGSLLVFPYYTSNAQTKADTRLTLTNLAGTLNPLPGNLPQALAGGTIYVHIFFMNGANCTQADMYVCLTKGASITFNASTQDPDITGYVIAAAVNEMGRPVSWNNLIGNAFVSTPEVAGSYGAEAFASVLPAGTRTEAGTGDTAALVLDGLTYDRAADQFAVEIQSPATVAGQTIVHASVAGNIAAGTTSFIEQAGTGLVIRGDEKQGSFVGFLPRACHSAGVIRVDRPRVPGGLAGFIPAGQIGTLVYNTTVPSVGVLLTPRANAWSGIRTLHKTRTVNSTLTIPVFMPVC